MRKFTAFCIKYHVTDPFPVTEYLLCAFATAMADNGLSPQTVKSYLAAIRNTQLSLGLPDPREQSSLPTLRRVQAGISRARLGRGQPSRVRLPVTAQLLRRVKGALEASAHSERILLWAVCCTAFFGFFRLGELLLTSPAAFNPRLHLAWEDLAMDNPTNPRILKLHLKQSKTDQTGHGADVVLGRTDLTLCPVARVRGQPRRPARPILPHFGGSSPDETGIRVRVLASLGLPDHQYAGHSFRIGAATSAALAGMEDSTIRVLLSSGIYVRPRRGWPPSRPRWRHRSPQALYQQMFS